MGLKTPKLAKAAFPRTGDESENRSKAIVRIDGLITDTAPVMKASASLSTTNCKSKSPGVIAVDSHNRVWEPVGDDNILRPTTSVIRVEESSAEHVSLVEGADTWQRTRDYLTYMPQYFVGRNVYRAFPAGKRPAGVFEGKVEDWSVQTNRPDHHRVDPE